MRVALSWPSFFFRRGGQRTLIGMQGKQWWIVGGAVGIGLLLLASSKTSSTGNEVVTSDADLDNLARMLIAETTFARAPDEMAAIVQIAINRARKRGVSISRVLIPPGRPMQWNGEPDYARSYYAADNHPRFAAARAFAAAVLAGERSNPIGGRTQFVHPGRMPKPPCKPNRTWTDTGDIAGPRCLPDWILTSNQTRVGGALFA
jgi:hypothetical protein